MTWAITETRAVEKDLAKAPHEVQRKYELWKAIVTCSGPEALRPLHGFNDEALQGKWRGFRASRLSLKWRVIYQIDRGAVHVAVVRLSPHDYGR